MENQENQEYVEPEKWATLGAKAEAHQPDGVWVIPIEDYEGIDPKQYFVTSGEGVEKAKRLEHDVWNLAGRVRSLRIKLEKARALNKYLETSWHEGKLVAKQKNPRNRTNTRMENSKSPEARTCAKQIEESQKHQLREVERKQAKHKPSK